MQIVSRLVHSLGELVRSLPGAEDVRVQVEVPPKIEMGDLATPVCFELARRLRRSPRAIAEDLAGRIAASPLPGAARVEVAGGGFLNLFLDRDAFLVELAARPPRPETAPFPGKIIVEHTNINPNKAAHIGHIRNAVLGDTLVRALRFLGARIEVQNYLDDTGVQVADLVVGFREIEGLPLEAVEALAARADAAEREGGAPFDHLCWAVYAKVGAWYEAEPSRQSRRGQALRGMEEGVGPDAEMAAFLAARMVRHHLRTMDRIGVRYDLLPRESDILKLGFWAKAFEALRACGAIQLAGTGKNLGCWVMDLEGVEEGSGEDQKIIVRSDGSVTYVGKDIAYQLWKFGLLGGDFKYSRLDWSGFPWSGYQVWRTASENGDPDPPPFGGAARVYNVIDTRQSYLQRVVSQGLRALGHDAQARESVHFSYEMVALSPGSVASLFPDFPLTEEDRARPFLEMSGRRGLGVKADDLIAELARRAAVEVDRRHPGLAAFERERTARQIAVAALRYYMLRFTRNRIVAFDIDAALSFEGETGPYCQYAAVRAANIFARLNEREGIGREAARAGRAGFSTLQGEEAFEHWALAREMARLADEVASAVEGLELSSLARWCHRLAQQFNAFYHRWPVLAEEDPERRRLRLVLCDLFLRTMESGLGLLGIEVPERM